MPLVQLKVSPPRQRSWGGRLRRWSSVTLAIGLLGVTATQSLAPAWAQTAAPRPLPALGDVASDELSVGAERRLGDRIMQEIRRDPDVLDDPLLADYVQGLWAPLLRAARARGEVSSDLDAHFAWETFLVRDRAINAFALPGGYVGVYLGLISMTSTRDEFASVLAHELSHVTQRHIARSMGVNRRNSMLGMAAMLLGVMAATRSNADGANALIVGGQAAVMQGQLNFSRDMEREADRVGFGVLGEAGYDPLGMVGMFERLQQSSRLMDSQQFPYLRSHPLTGERIGEARSRLGVSGTASAMESPGSGGEAARWLHAAMQGRARALMDGRAESLQRLAAAPLNAQGPQALTGAYAAALAAGRLKEWKLADAALVRALMLAGPQGEALRAVRTLQAELLVQRGQPAQAVALCRESLLDSSRASLLVLGQALLADTQTAPKDLRSHAESLQTWVAVHSADAGAWGQLGQIHERLGQTLAAVRALAEAQLALGDLGGAIDRLRGGQRLARAGQPAQMDSVDAAVIDSRLKALEQRRRRELIEERGGSGEEPAG